MEALHKGISLIISFIHIALLKLVHPKNLKCSYILDIYPSTRILTRGRITLGKKLHTRRSVVIECMKGGNINIGDDCFFNNGCMIVSKEQIKIGSGVSFGPNVMVYDHDHKISPKGFIHSEYKTGAVDIGNNVWIGANTVILSGTVIEDGCVVGAGCVLKGHYKAGQVIVQRRITECRQIKEE